MKRKFFKKALAVTLAMSMVVVGNISVFAENIDTSKTYPNGLLVDGTKVWNSAGGDQYLLSGENGVTIKFKNEPFIKDTNDFSNYVFEIFGGADTMGITCIATRTWTFPDGSNVPECRMTTSWPDTASEKYTKGTSGNATLTVYKYSEKIVKARVDFESGEYALYTIKYPKGVPSQMRVQLGSDGGKVTISEATIGKIELTEAQKAIDKEPEYTQPISTDPLYITLSGDSCVLTNIPDSEDVDCSTGYRAKHSPKFEITEEGIDISFKSKTNTTASANWNGPVYIVSSSDKEYFINRCDLYGWLINNDAIYNSNTFLPDDWSYTRASVPADWAEWLAKCKETVDCNLKAKLVGDTAEIEFTVNGATSKTVIAITQVDTSPIKVYGSQIRTNADNSKDLGIVSTIAKTDFNKKDCTVTEMGLKVQKGEKETVIKTDYVLSGDKLQDESGKSEGKLTEDTYFFRTILTGVDQAADTDTITVTPYVKFSDGTDATGKSVTIKPATGAKA